MKTKLAPSEEFLFPTPCVLVSCGKKKPNIITIAWCGVACSDPPVLYVSLRPKRFSYSLIVEDKAFGINVPTSSIVKKVDFCGIVSGRNVDKFKEAGFSWFEGEKTKVPLIKECPVNIELELIKVVELGVHHMMLGRVLAVYIDEDKKDDVKKLSPICYIPFSGEYFALGDKLGFYGFSRR